MKTHLLAFYPGDNEEILKGLREVAVDFKGKVSPDILRSYHSFLLSKFVYHFIYCCILILN